VRPRELSTQSIDLLFGPSATQHRMDRAEILRGTLSANGGFVSATNAQLLCALGGTNPGTDYGRLLVSGLVNLPGSREVELTNGFVPSTTSRSPS
jgi:hypothetical protein